MARAWSDRHRRARPAASRRRRASSLRWLWALGCRGGRLRRRHNRWHDVVGIRLLVASARDTEDLAIFARRYAVQPRLLGLDLPAGRLLISDARAGTRNSSCLLFSRGRRPRVVPCGIWLIVAALTIGDGWGGYLFRR